MRNFFLITCVVAGLAVGLWWQGMLHISVGHKPSSPALVSTDNTQILNVALGTANSATPTASSSTGTAQTADVRGYPTPPYSYHEGIKRVAPSIVSVYSRQPAVGIDPNRRSQGSGVIVDADGIILTNLHLIDGFNEIIVVLSDGQRFAATLIGSDAETDLAVVRIDANRLPFMRLDEAQPLKVGDVVLAIGNPFGVGQTVTQGIVSATRRRIANGTVWQNFIQIDAAINPGNSGGALINPLGQLVGVNTAVFLGDINAVGIGFSIPADLLAQVVPQIIENGSVSRGWLGLGAEDINMFPALTDLTQSGAVITEVLEIGPAYAIGVRPMDVVTRLGEQPIASATQLLLAVSALPPGATVKLTVLRSTSSLTHNQGVGVDDLEEVTYKVRLGARPIMDQALP